MRSLKESLFGKHSDDGRNSSTHIPAVAHFVSEDGESFVFDESQHQALIRFDGDDEVFALTPTPGPKGDIIYKNDAGEAVLKSTQLGGMILFSEDRPMGDPAAVTGKAEAFEPVKMSPAVLWQDLYKASHRASLALERLLVFDAPDVKPESAALYADAAAITSEAIIKVSLQSQGRQMLDNVHEVHLIDGRPPSAHIEKGALVLRLDNSRGAWGGHPSSRRIMNVIQTSFSIADERR